MLFTSISPLINISFIGGSSCKLGRFFQYRSASNRFSFSFSVASKQLFASPANTLPVTLNLTMEYVGLPQAINSSAHFSDSSMLSETYRQLILEGRSGYSLCLTFSNASSLNATRVWRSSFSASYFSGYL